MNTNILTCLKLIDESLCCPICKEPFKIPVVIVTCSHNFCSLCIRRYLSIKQECPICGIDTTQGNLCPNWIIDGLLVRFNELRDHVNQITWKENEKRDTPINAKSTLLTKQVQTDRIPLYQDNSMTSSIDVNDKQNSPSLPQADITIVESTPEFSLGLKDFYTQSQGFSLADISSTSKELFNSELQTNDEEQTSFKASTSAETSGVESPNSITDTKADCPVCGLPVVCTKMNSHLDNCLAREEKKKSLRQNTPKRQKLNNPPITKLAYNLLSTKVLRQKMKEIGLVTSGNKQELVRRHKEFLAKFHSEQDKRRPRRLAIVVEEFEREETERKLASDRTTRNTRKRILFGLESSNTDKLDGESHIKKYSKQFKELETVVRIKLKGGHCQTNIETTEQISSTDNSGVLHLSCEPTTSCEEITEPGSPELYVGSTPSECGMHVITHNIRSDLNDALAKDSQADEVRKFIDASLT